MGEYRKRPVTVDAVQFSGDNFTEADLFGGGASGPVFYDGAHLKIRTLEGLMLVSPGDWIIRGVKGEFYPCKPDIFDATYEPAAHQETPHEG